MLLWQRPVHEVRCNSYISVCDCFCFKKKQKTKTRISILLTLPLILIVHLLLPEILGFKSTSVLREAGEKFTSFPFFKAQITFAHFPASDLTSFLWLHQQYCWQLLFSSVVINPAQETDPLKPPFNNVFISFYPLFSFNSFFPIFFVPLHCHGKRRQNLSTSFILHFLFFLVSHQELHYQPKAVSLFVL